MPAVATRQAAFLDLGPFSFADFAERQLALTRWTDEISDNGFSHK